ncbi:hypothetical protein PFISCL1PPCAC_28433, partial [Pristionchus fissidentatus]
ASIPIPSSLLSPPSTRLTSSQFPSSPPISSIPPLTYPNSMNPQFPHLTPMGSNPFKFYDFSSHPRLCIAPVPVPTEPEPIPGPIPTQSTDPEPSLAPISTQCTDPDPSAGPIPNQGTEPKRSPAPIPIQLREPETSPGPMPYPPPTYPVPDSDRERKRKMTEDQREKNKKKAKVLIRPLKNYGIYNPDMELPINEQVPRFQNGGRQTFWFFILNQLMDPRMKTIIAWTGRGKEYMIYSPEELLRMWSTQQGLKYTMHLDSLMRNMRSCYKKGIFMPVRAFVYRYAFLIEPSVHIVNCSQADLDRFIQIHHVVPPVLNGRIEMANHRLSCTGSTVTHSDSVPPI